MRCNVGFGTAAFGLLLSSLSLVPSIGKGQFLPWPIIVGSVVYLAGGLFLAINARGASGRKYMLWLRMVRMGFIVIVFLMLFKVR